MSFFFKGMNWRLKGGSEGLFQACVVIVKDAEDGGVQILFAVLALSHSRDVNQVNSATLLLR